jgi:HlyD family secretion protein
MKKIIIPVIIVAVAAALFINLKRNGKTLEDTALFSGTVETTEVRFSFKTNGRIKSSLFEEGDTVSQGDLVAELDDTDEKLLVSASKAELAYREAALQEVLAGSRKQEIKNAKASVDKAKSAQKRAKADLDQAETDRNRFKELYIQNGISKRDYEIYETNYKKALNTYEETKATVRSAKEKLSLTIEGARNEAINKAKAMVAIAEASLDQAMQKLKYTKLYSPITGVVLSKPSEAGEYIQPGSVILTAGRLDKVWVRGYVNEKYLGKIKLGDTAVIKTDSYPEKEYKGKITYISDEAEFTPKSVQTRDERLNFMYRIKVTLENKEMELKLGMPVEGSIKLEQ